jgi:2-polyprenyl-3-methyl-5-hydroxy-6-metoxy-1,4-benzoquinol methylase
MQADYWNSLASTFESDVFQPVANDFKNTILKSLRPLSSKKHKVADIGCGTGSLLPLLASQFQSALALDLSDDCLTIAKKRCRDTRNVKFLQHDLSTALPELAQIDVGVCLNVAIMPDYAVRMRLLNNILKMIRPGGNLLLLVPSLESTLLATHQLLRWNLNEQSNYRKAAAATSGELGFTAASIRDGIVKKGGTKTKHYLKEELEILVSELGAQLCNIQKVEYRWSTEFDNPPKFMNTSLPWDWLVHLRAVRTKT